MTSVLLSDLTVRILRPKEMIQGKFVNHNVLRKFGLFFVKSNLIRIFYTLGFLMDLLWSCAWLNYKYSDHKENVF